MKELKIQVPEGYEIDTKNSNFECIRFIPIKKDITYKEVCKEIINNRGFYITKEGEITEDALNYCESDKNNATNRKQLERVLALNQLLNIAEYYNKIHPERNAMQYCIASKICGDYMVLYSMEICLNGVVALFNREEDAQAVINNPNFREILNTIYK